MKNIKTFEEWSPKFNRTLQGAYNQATVTNKGFGKAAKAVMDYAEKNITKEEFTATYVDVNDKIREFKFSFDPSTLLHPTSEVSVGSSSGREKLLGFGSVYIKIPIIIKDLRSRHNGWTTEYTETKADLYIMNPEATKLKVLFGVKQKNGDYCSVGSGPNDVSKTWKDQDLVIRFKDRTSIENFISMLIQAILSDPNKAKAMDMEKIYKWVENEVMDPKESAERREQYPNLNVVEEYFNNLPGDTVYKKILLMLLNKLIVEKDMRNFM